MLYPVIMNRALKFGMSWMHAMIKAAFASRDGVVAFNVPKEFCGTTMKQAVEMAKVSVAWAVGDSHHLNDPLKTEPLETFASDSEPYEDAHRDIYSDPRWRQSHTGASRTLNTCGGGLRAPRGAEQQAHCASARGTKRTHFLVDQTHKDKGVRCPVNEAPGRVRRQGSWLVQRFRQREGEKVHALIAKVRDFKAQLAIQRQEDKALSRAFWSARGTSLRLGWQTRKACYEPKCNVYIPSRSGPSWIDRKNEFVKQWAQNTIEVG
ncbi:hypothetical protein EDB19DRAFT_1027434 [Suillus lakei]|nr:hypothetical protein EDB19DRAFT_1027434 [Suillus lakei]